MRRFAVCLTLLAGITLGSRPTSADPFPGGPQGGRPFMGGGRSFARPMMRGAFFPRPFLLPRPFLAHRRFPPFFRFGAFAAPFGFYAPWPAFYGYPPYSGPPYYGQYAQPVDYAPQASYTPPPLETVASAPPVPPPPMPQVVEFSSGRYELRGDGFTIPYRWVWIPNPPVAPVAASEAEAPSSVEKAPPGSHRLYRWKDEQGVVHLTNVWEDVPPQYRREAKHPQAS